MTIEIQKVTARIGARVSGVDISKPLDEETVAALREALNVHKALVLDDVHLDDESHQAFVRHFGDITTAHPTVAAVEGAASVLPVDSERGRANHCTPMSRSSSTRRRPPPCAASRSRRTAARP